MLYIQRPNGPTGTTNGGDIFFFSLIKSYRQNLNNKLTQFPVDSHSDISDHVITENQKFTIQAVIVNDDFLGLTRVAPPPSQTTTNATTGVKKTSQQSPSIFQKAQEFAKQKIQSAIDNFTGNFKTTDVSGKSVSNPVADKFQDALMDMRNRKELVCIQIDPFNVNSATGGGIPQIIENCIMTQLEFSEDESTGDSVNVTMSFEQVRIVPLVEVVVNVPKSKPKKKKKKKTDTSAQAAAPVSKGTVTRDKPFSNAELKGIGLGK